MSNAETNGSRSELIDASDPVERVRRIDPSSRLSTAGPMLSAHGSGGVRIAMRDLRRIALWQLSEPMARQTTGGIKDDVPSAEAEAVWYFSSDGSPSENQYAEADSYTRNARVYHVEALPGDQRDQIVALESGESGELGIPRYQGGDRVVAQFNNQSGRWEILGPAEDLWRFELKTALTPGGDPDVPSTADAYLVVYDSNQNEYVTTAVEFPVADFLHTWDAPAGSRGYAKRLADSAPDVGWEVLTLKPA